EGTGAVPSGADHHADRSQFVLRLDDGVAGFLGVGIVPVALAVGGEGLRQRRRRGDRVPGADRGTAVYAAQGGGGIALHEDLVADRVATFDPEATETGREV